MENLLFCLQATLPIFLMMVLGMLLKHVGIISAEFAAKLNQFVFAVPLPLQVFNDLQSQNFDKIWDGRYIIYCFLVTAASIGLAFLLSKPLGRKGTRGEFIQAAYRSSSALIGIAFLQNLYGQSSMAALMIIGSVPLYNIMAVIVLSVYSNEERKLDRALLKQTLLGIVKNPIILGVVFGCLWSFLRLPMPKILHTTLTGIGACATPLGLMAMGAAFQYKKAFASAGPALGAAFMKLIGYAAIFLPLSIALGFRGQQLVTLLVMLGSATTVACYVMARHYGQEGNVTSSTIMLTTLFSAFTLTGWLYVLRLFKVV